MAVDKLTSLNELCHRLETNKMSNKKTLVSFENGKNEDEETKYIEIIAQSLKVLFITPQTSKGEIEFVAKLFINDPHISEVLVLKSCFNGANGVNIDHGIVDHADEYIHFCHEE